ASSGRCASGLCELAPDLPRQTIHWTPRAYAGIVTSRCHSRQSFTSSRCGNSEIALEADTTVGGRAIHRPQQNLPLCVHSRPMATNKEDRSEQFYATRFKISSCAPGAPQTALARQYSW